MNPLLEIKDLTYSYHSLSGETLAIDHLSFQVEAGEFLAIVGPSGCGKSTLLSLIAGLLTPETGSITTTGCSNIGYMLQKDHLLEWRTTYKNAVLGLEIQKKNQNNNEKYVQEMLNNYGLLSFEKAKPKQLSGGMRQRVALIRTLLLEPELLLLDEPFSALDYQTRLEVSDDIWKILKKEKKTAILITHDISEAISMADRVIVLSERPSTKKLEIPLSLTFSGERSPFTARSTPEFQTYFNQIWKELTEHEQKNFV